LPRASPVIGDHAVTGVQQRRDLLLPRGSVERESVDQDDWLAFAVVLVINVD